MQVDNVKDFQFTQVIFEALQALFLSLVRRHLIYSHEVEQWYVSALGLVTDEVRYFQECRLIFKGGSPQINIAVSWRSGR